MTDKQALREAAEGNVKYAQMFINPRDVLALLDELEALQSFRTAFNEWHDKTEWVQGDKRFDVIKPWGKHRADVLKLYIDHLESKLEAAKQRNAELERSETQLIDERDNAESALNDAYKAVMGQAPEWSNWFSFADAIDEIELACGLWRNQTEDVIQFRARIAELEAKLQTADKLQDSAFRHGLQHGFSLGQTDDQAGFEQCLTAYSSRGKDNG